MFLLGASSWRIEEIGRDRVIVTPAPGVPGAVPFWKGDGLGRPKELGERIGAFARWAVDRTPEELEREYDLDERAARNLLDYLREQRDATRVLPSDRTIVVERFRDEIGDWRLCVLSPYGGRVHAAWGLALTSKIRAELGLEADAIWSDDGIAVHLPDADSPPSAELALIEPHELEDLVVSELGSSALYGARFREAAARALLIPRAYPGKRTPLWQQRLKAQTLLEVARRYGDFPIVLEAYRECLRDVLDLPGLRALLDGLARRELELVEVETPNPSPFSSSLLFDYIATYMYEGDAPNAERRAAALSLDRDLLRELLGQEELRELIDEGALERLEDQLQRRSEYTLAATRDELHDTLRALGDITLAEAGERVHAGVDAGALLEALRRERRAVRLRVGGEERFVDAADAGLYRDALGAAPPGGLPEAFLAEVPDALPKLLRRYAATHGPFPTAQVAARYALVPGVAEIALRELERSGEAVRGELHPRGEGREWCDVEVLRRLRRASLAALRKEVEPAERRAYASFLPAWHGVDASSGRAGVERLREQLVGLQGLALTPRTWEREVLPRRLGAYSPAWLDELCASGELVWIGAGALGRGDARGGAGGRVALYFREDVALLGPPPRREPRGEPAEPSEVARRVRARLERSPCFFTDLLVDVEGSAQELEAALWELAWAGEATNDAFAPLRAGRLALASDARPALAASSGATGGQSAFASRGALSGGRFSARRRGGRSPRHPPGRWSLTAPLFAADVRPRCAAARAGGAVVGAPRDPHPRARARRGGRGGFRRAVPGAVPPGDARRRATGVFRGGARRRAVRAARRGRAPARPAPRGAPGAGAGRDRSRAALRCDARVAAARAGDEPGARARCARRARRRRPRALPRARRARAARAVRARRRACGAGAGGARRARARGSLRAPDLAGARRRGVGDRFALGAGAHRGRFPRRSAPAHPERLSGVSPPIWADSDSLYRGHFRDARRGTTAFWGNSIRSAQKRFAVFAGMIRNFGWIPQI